MNAQSSWESCKPSEELLLTKNNVNQRSRHISSRPRFPPRLLPLQQRQRLARRCESWIHLSRCRHTRNANIHACAAGSRTPRSKYSCTGREAIRPNRERRTSYFEDVSGVFRSWRKGRANGGPSPKAQLLHDGSKEGDRGGQAWGCDRRQWRYCRCIHYSVHLECSPLLELRVLTIISVWAMRKPAEYFAVPWRQEAGSGGVVWTRAPYEDSVFLR